MRFGPTARIVTAVAILFAACGSDGAPTEAVTGLVAHYELDGDGTDATGASSGTLVGGEPVPDRSGAASSALSLSAGNYIEVPHSGALSLSQDFTIAAWIKPSPGAAPGAFSTIFEKSDPERGGHSRYGLWLQDGRLSACFEAADNSRQPCATSDQTLAMDTWQHVAAVRWERRLILYVDGAEVANSFVGLYGVSQSRYAAFIGTDLYQEPAEWLHAALDDVRIYNRALETDEIAALAES